MTYQMLIGLILYAFVTSATPGPNNVMLLASGANFGFRRTVPHMIGISIGCAVMLTTLGLGVAALLADVPRVRLATKFLTVAYMGWLAWKIAHAAAPGAANGRARPTNVLEAAAFQWVNPKAWAMAVGAISGYAPTGSTQALSVLVVVFSAVNLPSVAIWAYAGEALRHWLMDDRRRRTFNWTMAVLLVISLVPMLAVRTV